jgi:Sulfotransferase domain
MHQPTDRKIFCIGAAKTGTTSLAAFFEGLGFAVGDQSAGELLVHEWARRNFIPIIAFARTAQVFQDIPFSLPFTFQALDQAFPGSKFIMSVRRDAEEWYGSLTRFATQLINKGRLPTADDLKEFPYHHKGWAFESAKLIYDVSEDDLFNRARFMKAYESHIDSVTEYFRHRPESLLRINVAAADAVERIMAFLEMPYRGETMPHLNRTT